MSGHQRATIDDTVWFWFAANDTSGSGGDGATPLFDVREAGAAAGAAPLLSGTPTLLTHANYPAGCFEVAVAATTGNGFSADDTFGVFCTLAIDSQNPTGFVGSCTLSPAPADVQEWNGTAVTDELLKAKDIPLNYKSDISTVTSQTEFIMTDSIALDNNFIGLTCVIEDVSNGDTATRWITDVVASTNTLHINAAPLFTATAATPDKIRVFGHVHPQYANSLQNDISTANVATQLTNIGLQYVLNTALPTDWPTDIAAGSALDEMVDDGTATYDRTTDSLQAIRDNQGALFTTQMTESYAADGVAPTPAQALFLIQQMLTDFGISGTTLTVKKIDGSTTAATFTIDDASTPASITRTT